MSVPAEQVDSDDRHDDQENKNADNDDRRHQCRDYTYNHITTLSLKMTVYPRTFSGEFSIF